MDSEIVLIATLEVKAGQEGAFVEALRKATEGTRREPGMIQYDAQVDLKNSCIFHVYERWQNADALSGHGKSEHMQRFGAEIGPLLAGPPKIVRAKRMSF